MIFRYARHTNNLKRISDFYTEVLGLRKLGEFEDHSNYNGSFLGFPGLDWHIEFTESNEKVQHQPNADDLLVFYFTNKIEYEELLDRITKMEIPVKKSKNPYWRENGIEIEDPDGFGIIISQKK